MSQASDAILARLTDLHPKIIDLSLDRVWRLLAALGDPQDHLPPVVHVAGTNGKGSTLAMLRAGLEGAGDRVHVYTSPHLVRFHERIRVAGTLIAEAALADLLAECEAANAGAPITYFEITTCAAFLAFARTPADWLLLETGLGGRLDATNVVARPALTLITPISRDHEAYLGDTVAKIAAEKAGILKRGVPCFSARQTAEARAVLEDRATALAAPFEIAGQDFDAWVERDVLVHQDARGLIEVPRPALPGPHQIQNAGLALRALRHLRAGADPARAMTDIAWPARLQRLRHGPLVALPAGPDPMADPHPAATAPAPPDTRSRSHAAHATHAPAASPTLAHQASRPPPTDALAPAGATDPRPGAASGTAADPAQAMPAPPSGSMQTPMPPSVPGGRGRAASPSREIWLDGGHNPDAGRALAAALAGMPPRPTHLIVGMIASKDVAAFLAPLAPHARRLAAVPIPDTASALPSETIVTAAQAVGHDAYAAPSVEAAVADVPQDARILICGSLYLAGQVLAQNG